jgi:hypothetical protein
MGIIHSLTAMVSWTRSEQDTNISLTSVVFNSFSVIVVEWCGVDET